MFIGCKFLINIFIEINFNILFSLTISFVIITIIIIIIFRWVKLAYQFSVKYCDMSTYDCYVRYKKNIFDEWEEEICETKKEVKFELGLS